MANGRAKRGGQVGMNGEQYAGGQFLPSTEMPKQAPTARRIAAPRKVQIERYVWVEGRADARPIFGLIVGTVAQEQGGIVSRFEPGIRHYGETVNGQSVDTLIARFNNGERWL